MPIDREPPPSGGDPTLSEHLSQLIQARLPPPYTEQASSRALRSEDPGSGDTARSRCPPEQRPDSAILEPP